MAKPAKSHDAVALVRMRNAFYRDNYRRLVIILLMAIVILFLMVGALVYVVTHPPKPKYFATNTQGRLVPLVALNKPNLSNASLLQWANTAAIAAFTYNFVNYRQELQAASEFFTPQGWRAFLNSLRESNNLSAVQSKNLVVSAVATGAPVIIQRGVINNRYSWRVQMPLLVTYQSANDLSQQHLIVTMLITLVSTLNTPRGIGIAQFIATPTGRTDSLPG
jgi:intracellular multiplication protein IcmL